MPRLGAVKLLKKIKIDNQWKLVPALYDTKGRVRRDHVRVADRDEVHPEGIYYIGFWSDGARAREAAGADAFIAAEKARRKQAERAAVANGIVPASPVAANDNERLLLADAIDNSRPHRPRLTPSRDSSSERRQLPPIVGEQREQRRVVCRRQPFAPSATRVAQPLVISTV
jgi:hypothetical protein